MFRGKLRRGRVEFNNPRDASTLRNRGFRGKNMGEGLSLDIYSSLYLAVKGRAVIYDREGIITPGDLKGKLNVNDLLKFNAFKFLRDKGFDPKVERGCIFAGKEKALILPYDGFLDVKKLRGTGYVVVVDSEGECILYRNQKFIFPKGRPVPGVEGSGGSDEVLDYFRGRSLTLKSGSKYGSDYRVYDGTVSHARYLLSMSEKIPVKDLVARVRVANSVRKIYVHGYGRKRYVFYAISWINV